jgi:lipid II:glycine glycyltransferase (peptidoglycan interpeptide bridge formation enzyme)
MVRFKKKFYLFKVTDTWFRYAPGFKDLFSLRMYSFVQDAGKVKQSNCIHSVSHTVELSLQQDEEQILSKFKNTVKQEIRKAEKEGVTCSFENDNDTFIPFFNEFAALKKIYPAKKETIDSIGDHFKTTFAWKDGELLVAHSYIIDEELGIARLFQSASKRLDEKFDRKLIGMANKLLTAKDISWFREKGFKTYDFGGYAADTGDKSLQGINEFKLSFGGEVKTCTSYNSVLYFMLLKISEKLDRRY